MERMLIIGGLFVLAGLCEIGGGYLVWGWMRDHKPLAWALLGALILAAYGVVAALQPIPEFGRVYAAYGGVFIALALAVGRGGGRVQAGQVGPPGGSDLRRGRRGDGRSPQELEPCTCAKRRPRCLCRWEPSYRRRTRTDRTAMTAWLRATRIASVATVPLASANCLVTSIRSKTVATAAASATSIRTRGPKEQPPRPAPSSLRPRRSSPRWRPG